MGQFIDQGDRGPPSEHGVDVHLFEHDAAVFDPPARGLLQFANLGDGLRPAVRLKEADNYVDAGSAQAVAFLEHVEGLADAGGEAEVDFQPPALLTADKIEKQFGLRLRLVGCHEVLGSLRGMELLPRDAP